VIVPTSISRVEEGRWIGTYWQPVVSLPRSSKRKCPFRASDFSTDFTIRLAEGAQDVALSEHIGIENLAVPRDYESAF
jgi:hypothetical protein